MSIFDELKRRNVIRVGIAYLAVVWLVIQVAETVLPVYGFSDVAVRNLITILAIGLVPVLVLAWKFEWTPDGLKSDAEAQRGAAVASTDKKSDRVIMIVFAVALAYFATDKFVLDPARDARMAEEAAEQGRAEALTESFGDKSIAVLAFDDMSPLGDQEYLADGVAEELLNLLATIRELRVISRSTAFTFKGSNATLKEIAEKLDVSYIMEGSVRKAGDKVRITAQLIDARTDAHVWSQTYNRTLNDVFAIQDEIAAEVVEQLKLELLDGPPITVKVDPRAHELYLRARHILYSSQENLFDQTGPMLLEAIEIQPDYVAAYATLSYRLYATALTEDEETDKRIEAEFRKLTDRIVEIDPDGAKAYYMRGWVAQAFDRDMQAAALYYERGLALDPHDTDLQRVVIVFLRDLGRYDEAIALGRHALLRDPACSYCITMLAASYRDTGRHEEAAVEFGELLAWHSPPNGFFWSLGVSWLVAGHPDKALAAFQQERLAEQGAYGELFALYDLGRTEEFEARFDAFLQANQDNPEAIARVYAWMGDNDNAYEWLDKMVAMRGPASVQGIGTDLYEKIKSDPRWRMLREENGITNSSFEDVDFTLPPEVFTGT